jgi:rhodanese-related sulfurtransferase
MTGGVARTDLLSPDQTVPLARASYRSIRRRLFTLPDELAVYPTHGAGSFCSVGSDTERTTTMTGRPLSRLTIAAGTAALGDRSVIDVRQATEYATGHVSEAIHVELGALVDSTAALPPGSLLVHCGHGERAATAASLLRRNGHADVAFFEGGPADLGELVKS